MSSSSRLHVWFAIIATAAFAGCSGTISIDGTEQGSDPTDPADPTDPNGDPPAIVDPVGTPPNTGCGDGSCAPPESCATCSQDCGPCGGASCGNNVCSPNESCVDCPQDCGACPCAHPTCSVGEALEESCSPCVAQICAVDPFCCDVFWDGICQSEVGTVCGTPCPASCGDGLCDASESCSSCSQDCGACPVCGDFWCDWTESCSTCSQDCGPCPVCGDGTCDWTEGCDTCAADCGACAVCGNGQCEPGESCSGCPGDCGACLCHDTCLIGDPLDATCSTCVAQICAVDSFCCDFSWDGLCVSEVGSICGTPCPGNGASCGDGSCDPSESCSTCSQDCGACVVCGNGTCDQGENCGTCAGDCGVCAACPGTDLGSTAPQTVTGSTVGQSNALTPACGFSSAPEVTYSFTAPGDGDYEFNTFGSSYDSVLEVRDGTCQGASLACNDDAQGLQSRVFVTLTAGQTVIIVVDGFASAQGAFTLNVL